jgi:hypothetical protein
MLELFNVLRFVIYLLVKFVSAMLGLPILALSLYCSYRGVRTLIANAVRNLERECLDVQMFALKDFQPDIVIGTLRVMFFFLSSESHWIGSSWGGNILLRLINQGKKCFIIIIILVLLLLIFLLL